MVHYRRYIHGLTLNGSSKDRRAVAAIDTWGRPDVGTQYGGVQQRDGGGINVVTPIRQNWGHGKKTKVAAENCNVEHPGLGPVGPLLAFGFLEFAVPTRRTPQNYDRVRRVTTNRNS